MVSGWLERDFIGKYMQFGLWVVKRTQVKEGQKEENLDYGEQPEKAWRQQVV